MKKILFTALLMALPSWLASTFADTNDDECKARAHVTIVREDGKIIELGSDPGMTEDAEVHAFVVTAGGDKKCCAGDKKCCAKGKKLKVVARMKTGDTKSRGWLGVSIGETPESLADQLNLEGRGVMILR